jgi:hypothetical protein
MGKTLQKKQKKKLEEQKKKASQKQLVDLGALAAQSKLIKKAKTQRGRKILEAKAP